MIMGYLENSNIYARIAKTSWAKELGSASYSDVLTCFLNSDTTGLAELRRGHIPHSQLAGNVRLLPQGLDGIHIESLVSGDRVLLFYLFRRSPATAAHKLDVLVNSKLVSSHFSNDLPSITKQHSGLRHRHASVIEIPFNSKSHMSIEITSDGRDIFGASFERNEMETSSHEQSKGGFLGLDQKTNTLIGWAMGNAAKGHHAVIQATINGRISDYIASYPLREKASLVPKSSRLYRICLRDLGAGIATRNGSAIYRITLKHRDTQTPQHRGAFHLIRCPNSQILWWRARLHPDGRLFCSAVLLNNPEKQVRAEIKFSGQVIWRGALSKRDPIDLHFIRKNNSLECNLPRRKFNLWPYVKRLDGPRIEVCFEVNGTKFWTQKMTLKTLLR